MIIDHYRNQAILIAALLRHRVKLLPHPVTIARLLYGTFIPSEPTSSMFNTIMHYLISCRVLEGHKMPVKQLIFSDGGDRLISCSLDGSILIWDWKKGKVVKTVTRQDKPISAIDYPVNRETRVTCGMVDGSVNVWDIEHQTVIAEITGDSELFVLPLD